MTDFLFFFVTKLKNVIVKQKFLSNENIDDIEISIVTCSSNRGTSKRYQGPQHTPDRRGGNPASLSSSLSPCSRLLQNAAYHRLCRLTPDQQIRQSSYFT